MKLGRTSKGYMCLTAFEHELEGDCKGTKVYPSLEALKETHKCLDQCGIVEVEVKSIRVVQEADYSVEGIADRMFAPIYKFQRLAGAWKKDTFLCSSIAEIEAHPSHRGIVEMGARALPLIMVSLENEASIRWFGVLCEITGANPVPVEDRGRVAKMRDHWLKWWAENKEHYASV
jgi:hypothetical protein